MKQQTGRAGEGEKGRLQSAQRRGAVSPVLPFSRSPVLSSPRRPVSPSPRLPLLLFGALLLVAGAVCAGEPWASEQESQAVLESLKSFFAGAEVRYPGSAGNLKVEQKVADAFAAGGFQNGAINFQAPVFRPGKTSLSVAGQAPLKLYTLHPTMIRPGNFKQKHFESRLVYLGKGNVEDLAAVKDMDLNGALGVLEFDSAANWSRFLRFGMQGFIFIGGERFDPAEAAAKIYVSEVSVPRFFVGPEEGAGLRRALKDAKAPLSVTVDSEPSRWELASLRDLWTLIPGNSPDYSKEVCVLVAPLDSNCVVPELGQSAQSGTNLHLLLRLLESFKAEPPARPVLLVALNAHTQYFLGERMLAWHLLAKGDDVEEVRNQIVQDIKQQEKYCDYYGRLDQLLTDEAQFPEADKLLVQLRELTDNSTGKALLIKKPLVARVKSDLNKTKTARLQVGKQCEREGLSREATEKKLEPIKEAYTKYVNVLTLFNRWGRTSRVWAPPEEAAKETILSAEERGILHKYVKEELSKFSRFAELNHRDERVNQENNAIRAALEGRSVRWVLCLDLTWRGRRLGLSSSEYWLNQEWRRPWANKTVEVARQLKGVTDGKEDLFVNTMTGAEGGLPEGYYFPVAADLGVFHGASLTPAFSLLNVFTYDGRAFTVGDTFASLDARTVGEVTLYVPQLLRGILGMDSSMLKQKQVRQELWTVQLRTLRFDEFSAAVVPELEVPNTFLTLRQPWVGGPTALVYGDVLANYSALTDERGVATIYGIREWNQMASVAYHFDRDFIDVDFTIDAGEKERSLTSNVVKHASQTIVMFPCKELPIYARENPALISTMAISMTGFDPLDSKRETNPRQFGLGGCNSGFTQKSFDFQTAPYGPAAVYSDFRQRLKLLTPRGKALNASKEAPEGIGFNGYDELGPDFLAACAKDMAVLNRYRLGRLRGISQELANLFLDKGDQALKAMASAKKDKDHVGYLQALYTANGAEYQAYSQISGITNDMLRAVVFYMALILPFCFFMQKLLFNVVRIEAQIGLFFGLFAICYLAFRQIHPAFDIAKSPEGILIAFVMGALGAFVIKILHGRFEGEMQLLFRNYSGVDTSEIGYSTVGQKAMLIGVNNMRRRRVRTALTTATIVLVTFTMLSFTSISQKMSPTVVTISANLPPYNGIMYHWPGRCMDEATMNVCRELFHGKGDVLVRRWLRPPIYDRSIIPFHLETDSGKTANIEAVLGLDVAEDGFLGQMPLTAGRFFSKNDAREVILPARLAEALGITAQNLSTAKLNFRGLELPVVGLVSDEKLRLITDLDTRQILPDKIDAAKADLVGASGPVQAGESDASKQQAVDTAMLLLMPLDFSAELGAQAYSVSVRLTGRDAGPTVQLWQEMVNLLTVTQANFYIGSRTAFSTSEEVVAEAEPGKSSQQMREGVYYIGSGFANSYGNFASLIIPLLISGTIILNTMLGSVFERKKEIAIYNAIGLNPNHIGMFFLSEAFVYSVVGSVGGYLIGQGLSILIQHLGVEGIDVNFSSLKVVYVILFTVAMVLLSTLYPAIVATRAAVPSGKRRWAFPEHDGHQMKVIFPFIYHPNVVSGVTSYLEEYFSRFTEASVGDLIATLERKTKSKDEAGRDIYRMEYMLALAPFDLGVTQRVIFEVSFNERVQSYGISMANIRVSGQDTNWVTTNKPFLERLRTYLMHWRNLDATQQALYAEAATKSFDEKATVVAVV